MAGIHGMLLAAATLPPVFAFSIPSNISNANLRTLAIAAGWNGASSVIATINSGVVVGATSTGVYGLTIDGSWPMGGRLINKGSVVGRGGDGGNGARGYVTGPSANATAGSAGGPGLLVSVPFEIDNGSGTLAAGGISPAFSPPMAGGPGNSGGSGTLSSSGGGGAPYYITPGVHQGVLVVLVVDGEPLVALEPLALVALDHHGWWAKLAELLAMQSLAMPTSPGSLQAPV